MNQVDLYAANMRENSHSGTAVRTDAIDAAAFLDAFSLALCDFFNIPAQPMKKMPRQIDAPREVLRAWLNQAFDIHCKLRGYKSNTNERRVIWAGDVEPYHAWNVASVGPNDNHDEVGDGFNDKNPSLLIEAFRFIYGGPDYKLVRKLAFAIGIDVVRGELYGADEPDALWFEYDLDKREDWDSGSEEARQEQQRK